MPAEGTWEVTAIDTIAVECGVLFISDPSEMLPHPLTHVGETGFSLYDVNGDYDCEVPDGDFTCNGDTDLIIGGTISDEDTLIMTATYTPEGCTDESSFTFERMD